MNKMCGACGLKMSYLRKTVAFSVKRKKITYKVAYMTTGSKILDAAEMLQTSLNGSALPIAKIVLLKKLSKLV